MPSTSRQVVIREATEADTDTIIRLIKELAVSRSQMGSRPSLPQYLERDIIADEGYRQHTDL